MTTFARSLSAIRNAAPTLAAIGGGIGLLSGNVGANYQSAVRNGYGRNEVIYSAINLRANSAAEPRIIGRRYMSPAARQVARERANYLRATGMPLWAIKQVLNQQRIQEDLGEWQHPLVRLLNNPNPMTSRYRFFSTQVMDRDLAGNAYMLKARDAIFGKTPMELWRLRPDRVRVQTDSRGHLTGYTYTVGNEVTFFPKEDVIHWKTLNPIDDHYGMPPLLPLSRRLDIDNFMTDFVSAFFQNGAQPGGVLAVKGKMSDEKKKEARERLNRRFGPGNWFETMVLDQNEATFTPMTSPLGQRGIVMPELNDITEARIAMTFGIPPSILNLLVGLEKSSYANQRQDWQILWDVTLAPLYSDLDDQLTLSLVPDFQGVRGGIDEVLFDLSDVKALQEDVDKIQERARKNFQVGGWTREEFRVCTGMDPEADGIFLTPLGVSSETAGMRTLRERVEPLGALIRAGFEPEASLRALGLPSIEYTGELPVTTRDDEPPAPQLPPPSNLLLSEPVQVVDEYHCPDCGRWVGRNLNVGATVYCQKCKEIPVVAS